MIKKILLIVLLASIQFSFTNSSQCDVEFPFKEGSTWSYNNLDKKNKVTSVIHQEVMELDKSNGIKASIKQKIVDTKDEETQTMEYEIICDGNKIKLDLSSLMMGTYAEQLKDLFIEITSDDLEYPQFLSVGDVLPESKMSVKVSSEEGGPAIMTWKFNVVNRKVESKEMVEVPAGQFECYKITYDVETKVMLSFTTKGVSYYKPGFGSVKEETYNKKGKYMSGMELAKLDL